VLVNCAGTSGAGDAREPGRGPLGLTDEAWSRLLGFVRALARSCGPLGIRANAVCPGVIDPGMTDPIPRALIEPMKAMTPLQRYGSADDIAMACLYLASDESAFVTGEVISPNGGLVIY